MTLLDRARGAAQERNEESTATEQNWPWDRYVNEATALLEGILGQDPGPAEQLHLGTKQREARIASYPGEIQRGPVLVYYPEGVEVVAWLRPKGWQFGVVHRSQNPMEEAIVAPFNDLSGFGRAIGGLYD